jgi:hypothetical protein
MQKKDSNKIDQKLIDKIIRVAYGDAGIFNRLYILWKTSTNKEIKKLFDEYKLTAKLVHRLELEEVPSHLIQSVRLNINSKEKSNIFTSFILKVFYDVFGNKAIPASVLGVILVIVISFLIFNEPSPSHKYSKTEIELAEKQFKQTFAIVGRAFENAEKSFSDEILNKQVNKKLNKGYYLVNNILIGG